MYLKVIENNDTATQILFCETIQNDKHIKSNMRTYAGLLGYF